MPNSPQRSHAWREKVCVRSRSSVSSGSERANRRTESKNSDCSGLTHSMIDEAAVRALSSDLLLQLLLDKPVDIPDRSEVGRRDVAVVDLDVELVLDERHHLGQAQGVDDAGQH